MLGTKSSDYRMTRQVTGVVWGRVRVSQCLSVVFACK